MAPEETTAGAVTPARDASARALGQIALSFLRFPRGGYRPRGRRCWLPARGQEFARHGWLIGEKAF